MEANHNDSLLSKAESLTNSTLTSSVTLANHDNDQHIMLFYTVYPCMAAILGTSLNAGSILVIAFGKMCGKGIKLQLVNLAITNMVGAVLIPSYLISTFQPHAYYSFLSSSLCKFLLWTIYSPFYVSLLCNMVISLERFVAIYFPLFFCNSAILHFCNSANYSYRTYNAKLHNKMEGGSNISLSGHQSRDGSEPHHKHW